MGAKEVVICLPTGKSAKIIKWKVEEGTIVYEGRVILLYDVNTNGGEGEHKKLKATEVGTVRKLLAKEGELVLPGGPLLELERGCSHPTVMNDLCAECGADLRKEEQSLQQASVPMVHSVPDLKVSEEQAKILGRADEERLIQDRKLVLLVDLDQTLIHTTNDNIPNNLKDVYHFQLYGPKSPWYHTRLRPGTHQFLTVMSKYYELHICTFGARNYAHMIAHFLDPEGKFFSHRILSRDECFNPNSKMANLKALFPCGDNLVCIIDDREDVWNFAPNLIHVKPYHFFRHTGDIHAPPGLSKCENDDKEGFDFSQFAEGTKVKSKVPYKSVKCIIEEKEKKDVKENELEEGELKSSENTTSENEQDSAEKEKEAEDNDKKPKESDRTDSEKDDKIDDLLEVEESDDYLLYLEEILRKVHIHFYDNYDKKEEEADLKHVIPALRKKVLAGTRLLFSGLVPTNASLDQSKAYYIAKSLGAEVVQELDKDITHLIAVRTGTAKVNAVKKLKNVKVVTPDWLWMCAERWERVEESLFPVTCEKTSSRHPPPHCVSPTHTPNTPNPIVPAQRQRTPSGRFMDTINPLMSFSSEDIADMDAEVEDICNESESDGEGKAESNKRKIQTVVTEEDESSSSSADSLAGEHVRGWGSKRQKTAPDTEEDESLNSRFRRGEDFPSDVELDEGSGASVGSNEPPDEISDGDWNMMGAALEREFLEGD
ncbi:RNA polymerase II subunit A C-terminal domain phosphatase Fcp1 [Lycorma delicatula]|uniref:RNA polymerase II subunit A C-terminal domain phosphatase Fcp1 n=1 Tax=Lycorma delicatula TaxID=130591 RepID=UPI003F50EA28